MCCLCVCCNLKKERKLWKEEKSKGKLLLLLLLLGFVLKTAPLHSPGRFSILNVNIPNVFLPTPLIVSHLNDKLKIIHLAGSVKRLGVIAGGSFLNLIFVCVCDWIFVNVSPIAFYDGYNMIVIFILNFRLYRSGAYPE